jgi:hypothetical protein
MPRVAFEDHPLVRIELGHRNEPPRLAVELAVVLRHRDPDQLSLVAEGPAVIRALEGLGIPPIQPADPIPPVPAHVEEGADPAVSVATEEHRVLSHVGADEVPGPGDLALVTEVEPAAGEHPLLLQLIELRIREDPPVHEPPVEIHEGFAVDASDSGP